MVSGNNGVAVRSGNQFINYTSENGLPSDAVSSMAASSDGKSQVGTDKAGLFQEIIRPILQRWSGDECKRLWLGRRAISGRD